MMAALNPDLQTQLMQKPMGEIAEAREPTIAIMRQAYGENAVVQWLRIHITKFLMFCGGDELTPDQIRECAYAIMAEYYYLNAYEVIQFFGLCRTAKYGTFFGKPNPLRLMEMLREHAEARSTAIERMEREKTMKRINAQAAQINGYNAYLTELRTRAAQGDKEAEEMLKKHNRL